MTSKDYKSNHALDILKKLNDDRKKMKNYCDVTLTAESNDFDGHKCILGVFSKFFSAMFCVEMKEKYESKGRVQGMTEETMETVLNFIYTCDVTITNANVYNLIEAAEYMQIPILKQFCLDFLLEEINSTNCLHIRAYAKLYDLNELVEKADSIIAKHFENLTNEREFNELNFKDIKEILVIENKQVTSEEIVFHAVIQWIKYDISVRNEHLAKLFSLVNINELSLDFLQNVVREEDLIMGCHQCTRMCFESTVSRASFQPNDQVLPEQQKSEKCFLAIQGNRRLKYELEKKVAIDLPNTNFNHNGGSAVHHEGMVYVISGSDTKSVERLDLDNQSSGWTELSSISIKRDGGASVIYADIIYNCGGWSGLGMIASSSGQRYSIDQDKWTNIASMNEGRSYFGLVSIFEGIYAVGGCNRFLKGILKTVECYDFLQDTWKSLPSMAVARQSPAVVVLDDHIYAIGGFDKKNLKSVERFNVLTQTWSNIADMNVARQNHGACVLNGKIYVAGGGSTAVEVYDPVSNTWEIEASIQDLQDVQFFATT